MARKAGPLTRCDGKWSEAKYVNFIKNLLRSGSRKWGPTQSIMRDARTTRGMYLCNGCQQEVPVTVYDEDKKRRIKNVFVDHINPIVSPEEGFTTWDSFIANLFCERDNLQVLCNGCHKDKTAEETTRATERRRKEKDNE